MADVIITMVIDIVRLGEAIANRTNINLGSLITHEVTGGTLLKGVGASNLPDSTKDIIDISKYDNLTWKLKASNGVVLNCVAIGLGFKNTNNPNNNLLAPGNQSPGTDGKQFRASLSAASSTLGPGSHLIEYYITFTLKNPNNANADWPQLTFDPKINIKIINP